MLGAVSGSCGNSTGSSSKAQPCKRLGSRPQTDCSLCRDQRFQRTSNREVTGGVPNVRRHLYSDKTRCPSTFSIAKIRRFPLQNGEFEEHQEYTCLLRLLPVTRVSVEAFVAHFRAPTGRIICPNQFQETSLERGWPRASMKNWSQCKVKLGGCDENMRALFQYNRLTADGGINSHEKEPRFRHSTVLQNLKRQGLCANLISAGYNLNCVLQMEGQDACGDPSSRGRMGRTAKKARPQIACIQGGRPDIWSHCPRPSWPPRHLQGQ